MGSKYRFVTYSMGHIILETEEMTLEEAQDYYVKSFSVDNTCSTLRLFVDGKKIPYKDTVKYLSIDNHGLGMKPVRL